MCGIVTTGAAPPVTVNALDPAGAANGAGLQVGDTIISINGENVTSCTHGAALLKAAVGEVKIVVTRQVPVASMQVQMQQQMRRSAAAQMMQPAPQMMQPAPHEFI